MLVPQNETYKIGKMLSLVGPNELQNIARMQMHIFFHQSEPFVGSQKEFLMPRIMYNRLDMAALNRKEHP